MLFNLQTLCLEDVLVWTEHLEQTLCSLKVYQQYLCLEMFQQSTEVAVEVCKFFLIL